MSHFTEFLFVRIIGFYCLETENSINKQRVGKFTQYIALTEEGVAVVTPDVC